jgi:hypothetical protein
MSLGIKLLLHLSVGFDYRLFKPIQLLTVSSVNVNLSDCLSLNVRDSLNDGIKLVDLSHELVVTVEDQAILNGHYLFSGETTRVIVIVALFVSEEIAFA